MDAVSRIVDRLVHSDVPLARPALMSAAERIRLEEAPLAGPGIVGVAVDALVGLGPLEPLLRDPGVSDVLVNGPDEIWVERAGRLQRSDVSFPDSAAIVAAVERVIAPLGLRLDRASPAVDARLADGSRLHAAIPPVAVDGPIVALRRFMPVVADLEALAAAGSIRGDGAEVLRSMVLARRNILVCGGTGAGKTTLLNVLSTAIPRGERVVTIEEAAELRLRGHVVRLEARPANAEGAGAIDVRTLVRHALRLRPDRIVVGEVRGPEALDMLQAMNTGHDGSMGTVHANGPEDALLRMEVLALSGGALAAGAVASQVRRAVDVVVHVVRDALGRRVRSIAEIEKGLPTEVYP